jgi:histidinol-phosphate/aromatic aminotransferase/cobyric acid decarboxylase-like protein
VQVPWSVNAPALAFLTAVVEGDEYMQRTWELTPAWRANVISRLRPLSEACARGDEAKRWTFHGREFLSWVWINVWSERVAEDAVARARKAGVPVRSGLQGYERPTFVRVAVREPAKVELLVKAWEGLGTA